MIIRNASPLYRILMAIPVAVSPYIIQPARLGGRMDILSQVDWRWGRVE